MTRRRLGLAAATLLLALALVELPGPPATGLDASWSLVLVRAWREGLAFGPELGFTHGPLGFLHVAQVEGPLPWPVVLWRTAGMLALAATFVALSTELPPRRRLLGGAALVALAWDEVPLLAGVTLAASFWLLPRPGRRWWQPVLAVAWLAFLAHLKHTFLAQAALGLSVAGLAHAARGEWGRAAGPVGLWVALWLAVWCAAGQALADLPAHLRLVWEVTAGHAAAMGKGGARWHVWLVAELALLAMALSIGLALRGHVRERWPVLLHAAGATFLFWRIGFTRADVHVLLFFWPLLLVSLALPPRLGIAGRSGFDLVPVLCLAGVLLHDGSFLVRLPRAVLARPVEGAATLARLAGGSEAHAAGEAQARREARRDDLAAAVGSRSIDLVGHDTARLLLGGFAWRPRPVFQSFCAYTPALLAENLRFLRGPRAPERVLVRLEPIDGRYAAQEDAPLLLELRRRWEPVWSGAEEVLLAPRPGAPAVEPPRTLLFAREVAAGEVVVLPDSPVALWLVVEARPTLLGRVRGLAVRPAALELRVDDGEGTPRGWRLIPGIAAAGLVIQPRLADQQDVGAFLRGGARGRVRSFSLGSRRRESWAGFRVEVWALEDCPLPRKP